MATLPPESGSIQILQVLPFPHPHDAHLDLIPAYRLHSSQPYITWVRNRATGLPSYSQGHYHADLVHAHHDLVHRYADLVELAYPSESTPNDPEPDPAPSPLPITLSLSEDTRLQTILVAARPYDLHQDPGLRVLCHLPPWDLRDRRCHDRRISGSLNRHRRDQRLDLKPRAQRGHCSNSRSERSPKHLNSRPGGIQLRHRARTEPSGSVEHSQARAMNRETLPKAWGVVT